MRDSRFAPRTVASATSVLAGLCFILIIGGCTGPREARAPEPSLSHPATAPGADPVAHYRVFTSEGQAASLADIVDAMDGADVVLIGETHDDAIAHLLQARLLEAAYARFGPDSVRAPALSLEMFARDVQYILDEYLVGHVTERHFLSSSSPWPNYDSDYRPMVEFARAHGLPVIAANAPRRYVNLVSRMGPEALDGLSDRAREALAPLPYPGPSEVYRAQWEALMAEMMPASHTESADSAHGSSPADVAAYLIEAQSLWDATMAFSIVEHLSDNPGAMVLHLAGGFHVERSTGIPEAIAHYRPEARTLTVAIRPAASFTTFDAEQHQDLGDFVILSDARLTASRGR